MANQVSLKRVKISEEEKALLKEQGVVSKRLLKLFVFTSGQNLEELLEAKVSGEGDLEWLTASQIRGKLPFTELNYSSEAVGKCLSNLGFESQVMRVPVREGSRHTQAINCYKVRIL